MSTLSGNTIASTYPSLLRFNNFTGGSGSKVQIVDGLGNSLPIFMSSTELDFRDFVDFRNATRVEGIVSTIAKKDTGGRTTGATDDVSFSAGTGMDIVQEGNTFTFNSTSVSDKQILYIGSPGLSTTLGRPVYWDGRWNNDPTAANAYNKLIGISNGTNTFTDGVIIGGLVNDSANTGYTQGSLYLPETSGSFTSNPNSIYIPNNIRGVGHSVGSEGIILNPDVFFSASTLIPPTPTPSVTPTPTITPTMTPTPTPTPIPIFYHIEAQNGDLIITQGGDNLDWFPL